MADIASGDLTFTVNQNDMSWPSRLGKRVVFSLAFGDGALTYPTGGIAIDKAKLGGFWEILALNVVESNNSGYVYEFDKSAQKLRIYETDSTTATDAETPLVELDGGSDAPAAITLVCEALVR